MWNAGNSTIYLFFFIKNSLKKICSPPWKSKPIPRERRTTRRSGNCLISQQVNFHNYLICHSASPPQPQTLTNTAPVFTNNKLRLRSAVPTTTHRTLLIFILDVLRKNPKLNFADLSQKQVNFQDLLNKLLTVHNIYCCFAIWVVCTQIICRHYMTWHCFAFSLPKHAVHC